MSDLHSINEAINRRAGRKLLPSIAVSLSLVILVWATLAFQRGIFAVLLYIAMGLGLREMVRAFSQKDSQLSRIDFLVAGAAIFISTWFGGIEGLALSTAISIPLLLTHLLMRGPDGFVHSATSTVWILIYLPFLSGFLILLAKPENGLYQVMTFVILVGCNDTFGYLVGVLLGKHPLAPKISPKKSIEGFVGSVIFTMIGGALTFHYWLHLDWWIGVLVGLFIVFTATSGDLVESAMKRDLSLKDMGTLLPGHGGALDRLDSVLFSAPALWLALELVRNFL